MCRRAPVRGSGARVGSLLVLLALLNGSCVSSGSAAGVGGGGNAAGGPFAALSGDGQSTTAVEQHESIRGGEVSGDATPRDAPVPTAVGPYMSGQIGASWLQDADFDGAVPGISIRSEVEFDTGIHLGAALGYDFGKVRLEGEFGYRSHEFEKMTNIRLNGIPMNDLDADGDIDAFLFLVNGFYDIDTGTRWTPYLGGGAGFAEVSVEDVFVQGIIRGDDDDTVFAYQLVGGVAYGMSERVAADLSYRFLATSEPDFVGLEEYNSHNLVVGIRFSF